MSNKKLVVTLLLTPVYLILLVILVVFPIEQPINWIDILFWSALIFLSITTQSETADMLISPIDAVVVAMMFIFPPWLVALLVLIFSINPRAFTKHGYGWQTEVNNHLIYGIAAAGTGIVYSVIYDQTSIELGSLGGILVAVILMMTFYLFNLAAISLAFIIRQKKPLRQILRRNDYGFPFMNLLAAPPSLLVAIIYQEPILLDWGGWSVILFVLPMFYAQHLTTSSSYQIRLANQKLITNERSHQAMIQNLPVGIYRTTEDGWVINGNQALVEMVGCTSLEELMKINVANFYL
ncbi:MAG: hypothetical protein D6711_17795 [Chloroflexi bacterium]|nr:MAG: hypothetical protein D6711_17795 [Chloroflexota bacterium]